MTNTNAFPYMCGSMICKQRLIGQGVAEELGHVLFKHRLAESSQPGKPSIRFLESRQVFYEREAHASRQNC